MIELGDDTGTGISRTLIIGAASAAPSPIDLTSITLDSRVSYSGPSHAYFTSSGTIAFSSANEWPLEYDGGVAIGRHEPEKATTNYQPSTQFGSFAAAGNTADWQYAVGSSNVVQDSTLGVKSALSATGNTLAGVYSEAQAAFIAATADGGSPSSWDSVIRKFTNPSSAILRWYTARQSSTVYLYGKTVSVPAGDAVASVFRLVDGSGVQSALAQVETGTIRTSPVIAGLAASAARAESSVTVQRDGNAAGITLKFSDGSTADIDFTGDSVTIPVSALDWSTRYIQTIEYRS